MMTGTIVREDFFYIFVFVKINPESLDNFDFVKINGFEKFLHFVKIF
jgi:hypothetical protein